MNNRIKELIVETGNSFNTTGSYYTQELWAMKFAELIGKEVLTLQNRHGNIKPRVIKEFFWSRR